MNKNNTLLSIFTMVAVFSMGIAVQNYQNASALTTTMNCAPNCFDEVSEHVKAAEENLEEADYLGVQSELATIKALISQLEQTTSGPSTQASTDASTEEE
jgi:hypothetical protein